MVTSHLPWKFHANRSSRFLVMLLTKKQRKKEIARKKYPVINGNKCCTIWRNGEKDNYYNFIISIYGLKKKISAQTKVRCERGALSRQLLNPSKLAYNSNRPRQDVRLRVSQSANAFHRLGQYANSPGAWLQENLTIILRCDNNLR